MNCPATVVICVRAVYGITFAGGDTAVMCPEGEVRAAVCVNAPIQKTITCSISRTQAIYSWAARPDGSCNLDDAPTGAE